MMHQIWKLVKRVKALFTLKAGYVYIAANNEKTKLITGCTDSLTRELGKWKTLEYNAIDFVDGKIHCNHLLYYERFSNVQRAVRKEREINKWTMDEKINLIKIKNPELIFLNGKHFDNCIP